MRRRDGMTILEIVVVLIIVGVVAVFTFPDYTQSTEQARSAVVQNHLLAIYSAQQNYNNNYNGYCLAGSAAQNACTGVSANCANSLAAINCNLSLNIQDDGMYTYSCTAGVFPPNCTAIRVITATTNLVLTLNSPINLSGAGVANPVCNTVNNWCR